MRQCAVCEKGSIVRVSREKLRGKYNPTNMKRKYPNLQYARVEGSRVLACAKCIKRISKA